MSNRYSPETNARALEIIAVACRGLNQVGPEAYAAIQIALGIAITSVIYLESAGEPAAVEEAIKIVGDQIRTDCADLRARRLARKAN